MNSGDMHTQWWQTGPADRITCTLCPRYCTLAEGQHGFCYIRQNSGGRLVSLGYGRPTGFGLDPIEKKPLNHFLPGTSILSFGTAGCNLGCKFCQNWTTSKARSESTGGGFVTPHDVVALAMEHHAHSIAYTYNEPIIFGEYVIDISREARQAGLKSVMVSAGYITAEARPDVFRYIDAANVDLKGFTESFYARQTGSHLQPVLDTLTWLHRETDIWLELTTLLIPGLNDSDSEVAAMSDWIVENLGDSVPLHFTAFHPSFRMHDRPATPAETVLHARRIALSRGIRYCYVGNILDSEAQATYCHNCSTVLIRRDWHSVRANKLTSGACPSCGTVIPGVFSTAQR